MTAVETTKSHMQLACYMEGLMWMMHLHVNKKSDHDDDTKYLENTLRNDGSNSSFVMLEFLIYDKEN